MKPSLHPSRRDWIQGKRFWGTLSGAALLTLLVLDAAHAYPGIVSLGQSDTSSFPFTVSKGSSLELNNEYQTTIFNLTVRRSSSLKSLMTLKRLAPGQSVNLEFNRKGSYRICYSFKTGGESDRETCLHVNVVENIPA